MVVHHAHSEQQWIALRAFCFVLNTGVVRVEAEYSVQGRLGRGMIDYVILADDFTIVVLEVSRAPCFHAST